MPAPSAPPPSPQPPPQHWTKDGGVSATVRPLRRVKESRPLPVLRSARSRPPPPRLASQEGCLCPGLSTSAAPLSDKPEGSEAGRGGRGSPMASAAVEGSVRRPPSPPRPSGCLAAPRARRTPLRQQGAVPKGPEGYFCHGHPQALTTLALPACTLQPLPTLATFGTTMLKTHCVSPGSLRQSLDTYRPSRLPLGLTWLQLHLGASLEALGQVHPSCPVQK